MEDRVPPLRVSAVNHKAPSLWALFLIFLFFIGFMFVLVLRSPLGKIERVTIEGNQLISRQEILNQVGAHIGSSYFAFRPQDAEQALAKMPEVKSVNVYRSFPSKVYVKVKERRMVAFVRTKNLQVLPLLENGKIMTKRTTVPILKNTPIFEKWDLESNSFREAVQMFSRCSPADFAEISYIHPVENDPEQVLLTSKAGHKIYVRSKDLPERIKLYSSFRHQPSGTLYLLESVWFTPNSIQ